MTEYEKRDIIELGDAYLKHANAMTAEGLHDKGDIAAELAWRDERIEDGIASMNALIGYVNDFGSDINPNVVKAEAGEAILRMTGKYGVDKR